MASLHESQNPFSTRFVRPGSIPYRFATDHESECQKHWDSMLHTLRQNDWWGQIVGPHGTGKSTLLNELLVKLDRERVITAHFELHDGERRFPYPLDRLLKKEPLPHLIVIDGYEQLGFWSRRRITRWCQRQSVGLLITTHILFYGFPTLLETEMSVNMAESLVYRHLESVGADVPIAAEEIKTRFKNADGNIRELFFALYDLVERKRREETAS